MRNVMPGRDRMFLTGIVAFLIALAVMGFFYLGLAQTVFGEDGRMVRAEFAAAPQLQPGDPVRVDGREEGRVREITDINGGRGALVTFDVRDDAGPLYRDAVVQLRWKSLLGGSFYLEVDRGTAQTGDLGDRSIPRAQTEAQVEFDDVTSIFEGQARAGLVRMPGELSKGLRDPAGVEELMDSVADGSPALTGGLRGLRGRVLDTDLRMTVRGFAATMQALDAPRDDLRGLVSGAAATLNTTAARDTDLRSLLAQGPGVTAQIRTTLARLDATLDGADDLVARLQKPADRLGPTLVALRPTLLSTTRLLDGAAPLLRSLRPAVSSVRALGRTGRPVFDDLRPSLERFGRTILPYMARPDKDTGKPTSTMIGGTAAGQGGGAGQKGENGTSIRFPATLGESSVNLPCKTAVTDPTQEQIAACQSIEEALRTYLGSGTEQSGRRGR